MLIYKATNKINGKVYVGQTTRRFNKRKYDHLYASKVGKYTGKCREYFHNALKKYGADNFEWCILEKCDSKHNLDLAEQWYIRYYRSFVGFVDSNGYNLTMGGNGNSGVIFSTEHRAKISNSKKGKTLSEEHKQKIRDNARTNPNYGNKGRMMSDEQKDKLSKAGIGKKLSKETRIKIGKAHIGNSYAKGYRHSKEFCEKLSKRMRGKNNPMYGIPCPHIGKFGRSNHLAKKYVIKCPDNKEFIIHGIFNFCNNYEEVKLHHSSLIKVAKGKQSQHKGYKCRYYNKKLDLDIPMWEE